MGLWVEHVVESGVGLRDASGITVLVDRDHARLSASHCELPRLGVQVDCCVCI